MSASASCFWTPMLLFSWTESDLLPLDEMFADCQLALSQHSAYYRIVKHTKCRPTTLVTPDSHRTHPDSHYNPNLHRCWPHVSLKVVNRPYLCKHFSSRNGLHFHKWPGARGIFDCDIPNPLPLTGHSYFSASSTPLVRKTKNITL